PRSSRGRVGTRRGRCGGRGRRRRRRRRPAAAARAGGGAPRATPRRGARAQIGAPRNAVTFEVQRCADNERPRIIAERIRTRGGARAPDECQFQRHSHRSLRPRHRFV
ncbi:hypothetical protein EVAR_68350_1, partial [Eumeta japonica]